MIKLILTLIMVFTFGTTTVNAEENTTNIEDRISELAEVNLDRRESIIARIDELSEDELKAIVANVNELTEPTEDDLDIKEAATNKLKELSFLTIVQGVLVFCFFMLLVLSLVG